MIAVRRMDTAIAVVAAVAAFLSGLLGSPGTAGADGQVVVLSKGGAYQEAQRRAYFEPFTRETGIRVVESSGVEFSRIKTMIEAGNPQFDVIDVSEHDLVALKRLGLLEKVDYGALAGEDLAAIDPRLRDEYGVPNIVWSMILAYNSERYPSPPQSWADFWDVERFPGLRTSQGVRFPPLEQAAFAMGTPRDKLYTVPIEKLIEKIKSLGDNLVIATTPKMVQLLASGEVGMAITSNGRIKALRDEGKPIAVQWNQGIMNTVYFVIPKGSSNARNAMKLIAYMSRPKPQAQLAEAVYFGPVNTKAYEFIDAKVKPFLSNHPDNVSKQVLIDAEWWGRNRELIVDTWNRIMLGR